MFPLDSKFPSYPSCLCSHYYSRWLLLASCKSLHSHTSFQPSSTSQINLPVGFSADGSPPVSCSDGEPILSNQTLENLLVDCFPSRTRPLKCQKCCITKRNYCKNTRPTPENFSILIRVLRFFSPE